MSLPCRLDIFRFRRTKKGLLAITNTINLFFTKLLRSRCIMYSMVTSQYWFTGLLPVARDMVFQKGECIVSTQKARLSPGGGKRKKLLTSVLTVFLRSCAYTCVSSYLIDGRQGKLTVFLGSYCLCYTWDSFIAVVGVFV